MFNNTAPNYNRKEPGPLAALTVAIVVAVAYTQGGVFTAAASLILLAVLITPVRGQPSLLQGGLQYLGNILAKGIQSGA
jgi:Na+/H+ antiporter NhaC